MKNLKLLILFCSFLFSLNSIAQTPTGEESEFDKGIKNNLSPLVPVPNYLVTQSAIGVYGKIEPINLGISAPTQTALDSKVDKNTTITGATNTKITYDSKGLVTSGTGLSAGDIPTLNQNTTGTASTITGNITQGQVTNLTTDLSNKVDKVTGKSLISDTEITRLGTLANYTHPTNHPPSIITQDASNRFVTDAEKTAWNAKQSAIGYTTENIANKNVANGYAGLGSDGKLISSQLPSITIPDTYVVASQVAMLGLTGAEKGDVAVRTDLNKSFILKGNSYSTLADWQELLTPTSAVTTVFGRNGAVTAQTGDYTATMVGAPSGSGTSTGTNTGDETLATIKTKLGISVLSGSNTGDQTTITGNAGTATVLQTARTINGVVFNGSSNITVADATKEPSFSKNTGFNKNFGTTVGTVAEGNDSRILNGQTAFGWGNHAGLYPSLTGVGANGTWGINISGNAGTATTASNSTQWRGLTYNNASQTTSPLYFMGSADGGTYGYTSIPEVKTTLGLGSNAYTSTAFAPLNGTGANGTWGINISGNASSATLWGGRGADLNAIQTDFDLVLTRGSSDAVTRLTPVSQFRTWLGLGSNAYSSTAYLPLTGGMLTGQLNITNNSIQGYYQSRKSDNKGDGIIGGNSFSLRNGVSEGLNFDIYNRTTNAWTTPMFFSNIGNALLTGTITATAFYQSSDRRLKTILKRDGDVAYFKWKDSRDSKTHIGYIAQEVRRTNPDQVQKGEDKMLSVNYVEILVEKIRMLEKRIEELEKK